MNQYNIQIVSNLTGLSVHTLRAWEKRYQAIIPERTDNGRRVYSEKEIEKLQLLQKLCSIGHSISHIANKTTLELRNMLSTHGISDEVEFNSYNVSTSPEQTEKTLRNLMLALEANKPEILSHEFYNLKMTMSPKDLALDIVAPLLRKVGQKVAHGELTVAQEHVISSIMKFHLGKFIYRGFEEKKEPAQTIMLTTPEAEYHEFGIILAALLCSYHKKSFFYLGPNMPAKALAQAIDAIGSKEVLVGTTMHTYDGNRAQLTQYFEEVLSFTPSDVNIIAGGDGIFDSGRLQFRPNFTYFSSLDELDKYLAQKALPH